MLQEFKQHIEKQFPELREKPFLLACSGGLDSMVLAHLFHVCGLDFSIAHCNFRLRGAESDADEKFVVELAKKYSRKIFLTSFKTSNYADKNKVSIQMAARELRYSWFSEIMKENAIDTLVTAHHADDNLETFLINLSRGTGIEGLIGIPSKTDSIARPLLKLTRTQILAYAEKEDLAWREDSSNAETKYLRNKIRHELVPLLKGLHPTFMDNFSTTQKFLGQTTSIAQNHIDELKQKLFIDYDGITRIPVDQLQGLNPIKAYLYGLFGSYGFTEWNDVTNLLTATSGKEVKSKTHRLIRDREYLLLQKLKPITKNIYFIKEDDCEIIAPIDLTMKEVPNVEEKGKHIFYVDKEKLQYPLTLRKWQKGDFLYPFGMNGKKKLSKFFKDEKVDVISKEAQWLLCSGDDIVWVIGRRGDNRFKVTEDTKTILKFTLSK